MAELNSMVSSVHLAPRPFAAAVSEDILAGDRLLRRAFLEAPMHSAQRDTTIISADDREPPALLIHRGVAFSSHNFPDGRRAIIDIMLPTDVFCIEHALLARSNRDIVAASPMGYRMLPASNLRQLMAAPQIAARMFALMAEARWRSDDRIAALSRLDAYHRIAQFLLGIYDRLRRAGLINRATFNLHLTEDQIGDHLGMTMVHVSRIFRRLRQDKVALVDRQVVIILDVQRLRAIVAGLAPAATAPPEAEETDGVFADAAQADRKRLPFGTTPSLG
jgi:CRP-like cAMP-binding protein